MATFRRFNTRAAILSPEQVQEIRQRYSQGETQGSLCRAFNVSIGTIGRIVRGETWKQYEGPIAQQTYNPPPADQSQIDETYQRLVAQGLAPPAIKDDRAAEVLERLEQTAKKDSSIQADKALEELLAPDRAKKFLE
jgi:hypothetical protein